MACLQNNSYLYLESSLVSLPITKCCIHKYLISWRIRQLHPHALAEDKRLFARFNILLMTMEMLQATVFGLSRHNESKHELFVECLHILSMVTTIVRRYVRAARYSVRGGRSVGNQPWHNQLTTILVGCKHAQLNQRASRGVHAFRATPSVVR